MYFCYSVVLSILDVVNYYSKGENMILSVAFEGIPASGKSTVINLVSQKLSKKGLRVKIIDIDNSGRNPILHSIARTFPFGHPGRIMLYWVMRLEQYNVLLNESKRSDIVFLDRFWNSTYVFDVCTGRVPKSCWEWVSTFVTQKPNLTFLFDVSVDIAQKRKTVEIVSDPNVAKKVKKAYFDLAQKLEWVVINTNKKREEVTNECYKIINKEIKRLS